MRSQATPRFWQLFKDLPTEVQRLAVKNYRLWLATPIILRCNIGGWKVATIW
jgi:hypothetical protein